MLSTIRRINWDHPAARAGIVMSGFGINQVLRLGMSIILTRVLAPDLMGVMVIVNTLRAGIELMSDVGIGANIVRHKDGLTPDFLRTAWTVQIIRGALLTVAFALMAPVIAGLYNNPDLVNIFLIASLLFSITGFRWISLFVLQKELRVAERIIFDTWSNIFFAIVAIAIAWWLRSATGLILGLVVGEIIITARSFLIRTGVKPGLMLRRDYVGEMAHFGRWIFVGSALYFCTISFDKLYLSAVFTLFLLGIYNVGRTLADASGQAIVALGEHIIFPTIAAYKGEREQMIVRLTVARRRALIPAALGLSLAVALSPLMVVALYDDRYRPAALVAPVLLFSVWPGLLSVISEMILRGTGRSAPGAMGNAAKLAGLAIGLPGGYMIGGMGGALVGMVVAEWLRFIALSWFSQRAGIAFLKSDIALTMLFVGASALFFYIVNMQILGYDLTYFEGLAGAFASGK